MAAVKSDFSTLVRLCRKSWQHISKVVVLGRRAFLLAPFGARNSVTTTSTLLRTQRYLVCHLTYTKIDARTYGCSICALRTSHLCAAEDCATPERSLGRLSVPQHNIIVYILIQKAAGRVSCVSLVSSVLYLPQNLASKRPTPCGSLPLKILKMLQNPSEGTKWAQVMWLDV